MDLYAYAQIEDIEKIADLNGIKVPRLRGYRLMSQEKPITRDEIKEIIADCETDIYERAMTSRPFCRPDSGWYSFSDKTEKLKRRYLIREPNGTYTDFYGNQHINYKTIGVRWDLIHGKNRKELKFAIKKCRKSIEQNIATFNKYVGRDDVLYIHARIGGNNWLYFGGEQLVKQPWFLEKVDDYYDSTYCDIYAKIDMLK